MLHFHNRQGRRWKKKVSILYGLLNKRTCSAEQFPKRKIMQRLKYMVMKRIKVAYYANRNVICILISQLMIEQMISIHIKIE